MNNERIIAEQRFSFGECADLKAASIMVWRWLFDAMPDLVNQPEAREIALRALDGARRVNPQLDTALESEAEALMAAGEAEVRAERALAANSGDIPQWLQNAMDDAQAIVTAYDEDQPADGPDVPTSGTA